MTINEMLNETANADRPPTIEAKEQSLEDRVSAIEQALASLGDTVSPGGSRGLVTYAKWRKSLPGCDPKEG